MNNYPNQNPPPPSSNPPPLEDIFASIDPANPKGPATNPQPTTLPPDQIANNPAPSQPEAIPPQAEAGSQNATGLETQPVLSENYQPEPTYQQAQVPEKSPFIKLLIGLIVIILLAGGAVFFLFFFNKGTLALTVNPREAQVIIDGQEYPRKINYQIKLPTGEHVLEIKLDGYVNYKNKININSFKTIEINIELKQRPTVQKLLNEKIKFIGLSPDKKYLVGLDILGKIFYRVSVQNENATNETGEENSQNTNQNLTSVNTAQPITEKGFANIVNVIWNPKKELAILKVKNEKAQLNKTDFYRNDASDGTITTWLYDFNRYDLKNQESIYLGKDIGDIVWTPDGEKIIYYAKNNKSLYQASAKNTDVELLKNIPAIADPAISIAPDGKNLTLVARSRQYNKNYLYLFDLYSKSPSQITQKGDQKGAIFNLSSDKILYASYSEEPNSNIYTALSLVDIDGKNNQSLDVRALIETVKFFDEKNFIYPSLTDQTGSEKLIKFNIETKEEHEFQMQNTDRLRFDNLLLAENKEKVYFLSENFLYALELVTDQY
jgi:hypothetical protein